MGKTTKSNAEILGRNRHIFGLLQLEECVYAYVEGLGKQVCPPIHPEGHSSSRVQNKASGPTIPFGIHSETQGKASGLTAWPHPPLPVLNQEYARDLCG